MQLKSMQEDTPFHRYYISSVTQEKICLSVNAYNSKNNEHRHVKQKPHEWIYSKVLFSL